MANGSERCCVPDCSYMSQYNVTGNTKHVYCCSSCRFGHHSDGCTQHGYKNDLCDCGDKAHANYDTCSTYCAGGHKEAPTYWWTHIPSPKKKKRRRRREMLPSYEDLPNYEDLYPN